jgi:ADP-ribose pyrophosphatase YjhB (NUDIX family)
MRPGELGPGVVVLDAADVRFDEMPGPVLPPEMLSAIDDAWEVAVREDPFLFDGPVVLCRDVHRGVASLEVGWSRATYRYRAVRTIPGAPALSSVFVCVVQPTTDGRLLVGRMSATTATPGVQQFPGGNLEPARRGETLTLDALRRHAATELAEETGVQAGPADLDLWAVVRRANLNLGFFFMAPALPEQVIRRGHEAVVRSESESEPEFDDISFVATPEELARLGARSVDYLELLVERFSRRSSLR